MRTINESLHKLQKAKWKRGIEETENFLHFAKDLKQKEEKTLENLTLVNLK
jgi:hypothetical protein